MTYQNLADMIGGKFWQKYSKTRIYLDRGFNTQKMRTHTYIECTDEAEMSVKCFIECESQPLAWIKSQQEHIIAAVEKEIDDIYEQNRKNS